VDSPNLCFWIPIGQTLNSCLFSFSVPRG
jgi:hypothetical protein